MIGLFVDQSMQQVCFTYCKWVKMYEFVSFAAINSKSCTS